MTVDFDAIPADKPVLIAGPTASGKSSLALEIADRGGGIIVNADAIQVFSNWRVLTARPTAADEARAPHRLYGHIPGDGTYSVGHWLREVGPLLQGPQRPIIVGGTGLYLTALTQGLAEIPATPPEIRAQADDRVARDGHLSLLPQIDVETRALIDQKNPMRVQRAWEVQAATGRGLAAWQTDTPAPLLALGDCTPMVLQSNREWLNHRIDQRFDQMLELGALNEARANRAGWDPAQLSAKAIGAAELIAYVDGDVTLDDAKRSATIQTHRYAKRQRTWFRSKMANWSKVLLSE